ncbi:hypothetical protein PR048_025721 [Dryococelus australis]|uniref:Uncharacterized protein n=1 Tax=Dryococelus australis TaxID=614101 RepID=A0ABQ9GJD9_9NEOP|nr:hypothetical protein PR048_025721 [Dryococelus australis]
MGGKYFLRKSRSCRVARVIPNGAAVTQWLEHTIVISGPKFHTSEAAGRNQQFINKPADETWNPLKIEITMAGQRFQTTFSRMGIQSLTATLPHSRSHEKTSEQQLLLRSKNLPTSLTKAVYVYTAVCGWLFVPASGCRHVNLKKIVHSIERVPGVYGAWQAWVIDLKALLRHITRRRRRSEVVGHLSGYIWGMGDRAVVWDPLSSRVLTDLPTLPGLVKTNKCWPCCLLGIGGIRPNSAPSGVEASLCSEEELGLRKCSNRDLVSELQIWGFTVLINRVLKWLSDRENIGNSVVAKRKLCRVHAQLTKRVAQSVFMQSAFEDENLYSWNGTESLKCENACVELCVSKGTMDTLGVPSRGEYPWATTRLLVSEAGDKESWGEIVVRCRGSCTPAINVNDADHRLEFRIVLFTPYSHYTSDLKPENLIENMDLVILDRIDRAGRPISKIVAARLTPAALALVLGGGGHYISTDLYRRKLSFGTKIRTKKWRNREIIAHKFSLTCARNVKRLLYMPYLGNKQTRHTCAKKRRIHCTLTCRSDSKDVFTLRKVVFAEAVQYQACALAYLDEPLHTTRRHATKQARALMPEISAPHQVRGTPRLASHWFAEYLTTSTRRCNKLPRVPVMTWNPRMERRWNARAGETGLPRENPPASGIVQHDSHMRKCRNEPAGDRTRIAAVGGERPSHCATAASGDVISMSLYVLSIRIQTRLQDRSIVQEKSYQDRHDPPNPSGRYSSSCGTSNNCNMSRYTGDVMAPPACDRGASALGRVESAAIPTISLSLSFTRCQGRSLPAGRQRLWSLDHVLIARTVEEKRLWRCHAARRPSSPIQLAEAPGKQRPRAPFDLRRQLVLHNKLETQPVAGRHVSVCNGNPGLLDINETIGITTATFQLTPTSPTVESKKGEWQSSYAIEALEIMCRLSARQCVRIQSKSWTLRVFYLLWQCTFSRSPGHCVSSTCQAMRIKLKSRTLHVVYMSGNTQQTQPVGELSARYLDCRQLWFKCHKIAI